MSQFRTKDVWIGAAMVVLGIALFFSTRWLGWLGLFGGPVLVGAGLGAPYRRPIAGAVLFILFLVAAFYLWSVTQRQ